MTAQPGGAGRQPHRPGVSQTLDPGEAEPITVLVGGRLLTEGTSAAISCYGEPSLVDPGVVAFPRRDGAPDAAADRGIVAAHGSATWTETILPWIMAAGTC